MLCFPLTFLKMEDTSLPAQVMSFCQVAGMWLNVRAAVLRSGPKQPPPQSRKRVSAVNRDITALFNRTTWHIKTIQLAASPRCHCGANIRDASRATRYISSKQRRQISQTNMFNNASVNVTVYRNKQLCRFHIMSALKNEPPVVYSEVTFVAGAMSLWFSL